MRMDVPKPLFMASLCPAFFGYDVGTVHFRVFTILQNAHRAWTALSEVHDDNQEFGVRPLSTAKYLRHVSFPIYQESEEKP